MRLKYLNQMEAELLGRLAQYQVEFAVVGGHAVLCYSLLARPDGTLRTLGDLDILIGGSDANLRRVSEALLSLRISLTPEMLSSMYRAGKIPNLTGGYSTQLFPRIDGVETDEVLRTSEPAYSKIGTVPIISRNALIKSKKAAGRPKDLQDVRALEAAPECPKAV